MTMLDHVGGACDEVLGKYGQRVFFVLYDNFRFRPDINKPQQVDPRASGLSVRTGV